MHRLLSSKLCSIYYCRCTLKCLGMTPRDWDNCMLLNSTPNRPLVEWWWYDTSFLHSPPSHSPPLVKRSLTFQNKCTTPGMVLFYLSYISIHISIPDWRVEIVFILWSKPSFVNDVGFLMPTSRYCGDCKFFSHFDSDLYELKGLIAALLLHWYYTMIAKAL